MSKQGLVFASCFLGILFLVGFSEFVPACLAQNALAPVAPIEEDKEAKRCLESTCRNAPVREKLSAIPLGSKYLRGILGGFEQGAGIGGGVQLTSADAIPALELRATALTSSQFYRRFDLEGYLPNIGGSRNHADVWFSYTRRETDFFGIGPQSSRDLKSKFASEERSYQGSLYRDITDDFQGGVYAQVSNSHSSPSFLSNAKILSYGGFFEYDTRDNTEGLPRGVNLYGRLASDDGLDNHTAFADYGWLEGELDIRGYLPVGSPRTSLALRSRAELKKPKGGSQIPFNDLSWFGGREYGRGFERYRFRGNNVLLFSTELRRTVSSKTGPRGVDVFGFADSGQVWGDARSTNDPLVRANQDFRSSNWNTGVGGGLQYRHSERFAARVEVGRSNEGALIYLSMSRGF